MINVPFNSLLNYLSGYGVFEVTNSKSFKKQISISEVSVLEIEFPDADWLKGNELILSTLNMCNSSEDIINIIYNLYDGNASALGIHNAVNKASLIDDAVINLANNVELPIIVIPATISYGQIISRIYDSPDKDASTEAFYFDILSCCNKDNLKTIAYRNNILINGLHAIVKVNVAVNECVDIKTTYLPILQRLSYRFHSKYGIFSFVVHSNDCFLFFIHFNNINHEAAHNTLHDLSSDILDELSTISLIVRIDILQGTIVDNLFKLPESLQSAEKAEHIINRLDRHNGIYSKEFLEIYYYLDIQNLEDFKATCTCELTEMRKKLGANYQELMDTLECYYETNCSVSKTAQRMFLHQNTIKYRLKLIRSSLGDKALDDGNSILFYHFLLKQNHLF